MFNLFKKDIPSDLNLKICKIKNISLEYPKDWLVSSEKGITNIYSKDDSAGVVTISVYDNIDFPFEKTPEFILGMNKIQDNPENVQIIEKNGFTEFNYEHVDSGVKWFTRVLRKNTNLYLITINCNQNNWDIEKSIFFKIINSIILK